MRGRRLQSAETSYTPPLDMVICAAVLGRVSASVNATRFPPPSCLLRGLHTSTEHTAGSGCPLRGLHTSTEQTAGSGCRRSHRLRPRPYGAGSGGVGPADQVLEWTAPPMRRARREGGLVAPAPAPAHSAAGEEHVIDVFLRH